MKRIMLFVLTNVLVMITVNIVLMFTGGHNWLSARGINYEALMIFCLVWGFVGSGISLLLSKFMAKRMMGVEIVDERGPYAALVRKVHTYAKQAGIDKMPEVGVYQSPEVNAFATGPSKNNSLVAVSTGLLQQMNEEEVEGVLAHEVAHIANGDMVTLTLIQGVVNTFVVFLSRVVGYLVDSFLRRNDEASSGPGIGYIVTTIVCDILFGVLASIIVAWFSRQREFRADAGAAQLMGSAQPMVGALRRLGGLEAGELPQNVATAGIAGRPAWMALFASHPPIEERIRALQSR